MPDDIYSQLPDISMNPPTTGAPSGGGGLSSILSSISPITSLVGTGIDAVGKIASLFKPDNSKLQATAVQQAMEKTALDIQDAVNRGQMDPSAAITQLKSLQQQAVQLSGNPNLSSAGIHANTIISQVLGNLTTRNTMSANEPLNNDNPISGDASQQKARTGSLIRNYFQGTDLGKQYAENSPAFQQIVNPITAPTTRLPQVGDALKAQFPDIVKPITQRQGGLY